MMRVTSKPWRDPAAATVPKRQILGMSAVLLPFTADGDVDWPAFEAARRPHRRRRAVPAVNMDTGYVQLLDDDDRAPRARRRRDALAPAAFVAGAFVADEPGAPFDLDALRARRWTTSPSAAARRSSSRRTASTRSTTTTGSPRTARSGREVDRFIGFELGPMFVPYGRIYSLDAYRGAARRSPRASAPSTRRSVAQHEWDRLALRDGVRPDFQVFTGNDLAIDMVMYGSDYLLGLSTFAPEAFAERDRLLGGGRPAFYELNDLLQYLGFFAFRDPVPAYRHDAAMFLAAARLDRAATRPRPEHPAGRQRTGRCSPTSPSGSRRREAEAVEPSCR